MKSISNLMPEITKESLGKKGLLFGKLLQEWESIIGKNKARLATPIDISFSKKKVVNGVHTEATLTILVNSSNATVIQHEQNLWIEKINLFFGYRAIGNIKLKHDTVTKKTIAPNKLGTRTQALSRQDRKSLEENLKDISDDNLKEALKNLGQSLYLKNKRLNENKD
tara:strand:- start:27 stop:527 length:501 start_codon:yes stop_codon:yes gene_type:complete